MRNIFALSPHEIYILSDSFEFYLLFFCDNLVGKLFKLLTPKHLGRTRPKLSHNNISLFQRQNWKSSYHTILTIAFSNTKLKLRFSYSQSFHRQNFLKFFSGVSKLSNNDKVTVKCARDLNFINIFWYWIFLDKTCNTEIDIRLREHLQLKKVTALQMYGKLQQREGQ